MQVGDEARVAPFLLPWWADVSPPGSWASWSELTEPAELPSLLQAGASPCIFRGTVNNGVFAFLRSSEYRAY